MLPLKAGVRAVMLISAALEESQDTSGHKTAARHKDRAGITLRTDSLEIISSCFSAYRTGNALESPGTA
jgi:hypothetical protein